MDTSSPERRTAARARAAVRTVRLGDVAPQAWRNGGGRTRELLAWPSAELWSLRISVAEIDRDGPFSAYPGVQRRFAVVDGAGVVLSFPTGERTCRRGDAPLSFDGREAPGCRLIDGPTRDLNLMARHGRSTLQAVRRGEAWDDAAVLRGLYSAVAGEWQAGDDARAVDAGTLLYVTGSGAVDLDADGRATRRSAAAWRFMPAGRSGDAGDTVAAWWFGYSPDPEAPR